MSAHGELGLDILKILTSIEGKLTVPDIQKVFRKMGREHNWTGIRHACLKLKNAGLISQEHYDDEWHFFILEHYQRAQRIREFHAMIAKWVYPNLEGEPFTSLSENDMLRIEYHWALNLSKVYEKLIEVLIDQELYDEEKDPVEVGLPGTPYGDEKDE